MDGSFRRYSEEGEGKEDLLSLSNGSYCNSKTDPCAPNKSCKERGILCGSWVVCFTVSCVVAPFYVFGMCVNEGNLLL